MKASSKEASGSFPAQVRVTAASNGVPSALRMEATNLLGGVEAVIAVEGKMYSVSVPAHPEQDRKGATSWGGIPLEWATDLFLGKIPCPESVAAADSNVILGAEGELVVQTAPTLAGASQKFTYQLKFRGTRPWADHLRWEKFGYDATAVEFRFYEPENHTDSPQRWEAKSSSGEVKVRWKDRDVH